MNAKSLKHMSETSKLSLEVAPTTLKQRARQIVPAVRHFIMCVQIARGCEKKLEGKRQYEWQRRDK